MEEKVNIEFTGKELDFIMQYMKAVGATTVQNAILNAVSVALDHYDNYNRIALWTELPLL